MIKIPYDKSKLDMLILRSILDHMILYTTETKSVYATAFMSRR